MLWSLRLRFVGMLVSMYLRSLGCKVGGGLKCVSFPVFRDVPKRNIRIGSNVAIGKNLVVEITPEGNLEIGDHVTVGDFNRFSSLSSIKIGDWVAIAELVSIRGSFHGVAKGEEIVKQKSMGAPISIGRDVLLGAQSIVLQGTTIPEGVIIGAQSLVKNGDKLHAHGIFAGSPLKHLRDRA